MNNELTEEGMKRARLMLSFLSREEAIKIFESEGMSYEEAYLLVIGGELLGWG